MAEVIVIGGANVDIKGRARDVMIEATSNIGEVMVSAGGVGRNIAENLARLDVDVALMSVAGGDANGRVIREACVEAGVDTTMFVTCAAPTGVYLAILDHCGELAAAINDMRAADALTVLHLDTWSERLKSADLLVADCNIPVDCLRWLCTFSALNGLRLVIEPISVPKARKLQEFDRPKPVFAITPNRQQLEALTGEADITTAIARLHGMGFANVIVHCGRDGAVISDGTGAPMAVPAFDVADVADVTGAGDAAVAGLVCGLVSGLGLLDAARLGQAAAAIKLETRESVSHAINRARVQALAKISTGPS